MSIVLWLLLNSSDVKCDLIAYFCVTMVQNTYHPVWRVLWAYMSIAPVIFNTCILLKKTELTVTIIGNSCNIEYQIMMEKKLMHMDRCMDFKN